MSDSGNPIAAAVFDLDGTLTHTVDLHEAAWKEVFDTLFALRLQRFGDRQRPFDTADYRAFVDGLPRRDGILALLDSRGIDVPVGEQDDPPGYESITSLAKRQRQLFLERLGQVGATPDLDTLRFLAGLRAMGTRIALASSDEDSERILEHVGLGADLFDVALYAALGPARDLAPKPQPDVFRACLELLEVVHPDRVVAFDDSIVGVAAARAAGIGLVVGIDRGGNASALRANGADWVVQGLREVSVLDLIAHISRP